jgi:hypothetical protein
MTNYSPDSPYTQVTTRLEPHNATLITPRGIRVSVNITPEAADVWARYGFKVEWFATGKKVAA